MKNNNIYKRAILSVSIIYAVLVAIYLIIAYAVTGGAGWDFVGAVIVALLTLPVYISVIAVMRFLNMRKKSRYEEKTYNGLLEAVLGAISLVLVCVSVLLLALAVWHITCYINIPFIRAVANVSLQALYICCVINVAVLLNRPISRLVLSIMNKIKHDAIDDKSVFKVRMSVLIIQTFIVTLILILPYVL